MADSTDGQTGRYQAYPEYKDSGVAWLGEVPKDWNTLKFGYTHLKAELGGNYLAGEGEDGIAVIKMGNLARGNIDLSKLEKITLNERYNEQHLLKHGDFLFNTRNSMQLVGKVAIWKGELEKAIYNSNILNILFSKRFVDSSNFMSYLFNSDRALSQLRLIAKGTTNVAAIYYKDLASMILALPSKSEQKQIANFLDYETAKIDTLIEKQQRLIELLTEKHQAVISHAVTKGLNPDVPMKASGVEWLGKVPAHWKLTKIKYVAELTPSKSEALPYLDEYCSFVPMEKLKRDSLTLDETRLVKNVHQGYTYFKENDLLFAKVTPCFENKNIAIAENLVNGIGFGSSEIFVLRTKNIKLNYFMFYRLQENIFMQMGVGAMTGAGGLQRVPTDFINNFQFALPPIEEAKNIVSYLENQNKRFDTLIDKANQQIQLMQERRTALISAAVTGKIDVRDWEGIDPMNDKSNMREQL